MMPARVPGNRSALAKTSEKPVLDVAQLQRLAEFRYQLRRFLHFSQIAAEQAGIPHRQYQLLQCVRGIPSGVEPTIANVAARMLLKHNSAVELVDRAIEQGLLLRGTDVRDHRRIFLHVTPRGERLLASLAGHHMRELRQSGPDLVRALRHVLRGSDASARIPQPRRKQSK